MLRFFGFLFWQTVGAAVLAFAAFQLNDKLDIKFVALVGALIGGMIWLFFDSNRSTRFLNWLRLGNITEFPRLGGSWTEAFDRTRRLLQDQSRNLQHSNQRLDDFLAAIQASPNGVVLLDKNEQIEWCNLTAASHFGLNPTKDVSQHIGNLVRDPDFKAYLAAKNFANQVTIPGKNGARDRSTRLAVHLHPYGEGKKLLLSHDITAIESAEIMRRDFVANVSHEIRTPLTVMSGFIETLQTLDLNDSDRTKYLALMEQQSIRMQSLVSDLLTLSRLEGSPAPIADVWVSFDVLAESCRSEAEALKNELYGSLRVEPSRVNAKQNMLFDIQGDLEFAGSQTELLSAMCNLVNNAVRYTPEDGTIRVSFQALDRGGAVFTVSDTGSGISPEHLPRLTERFYRVDASRSRESGGTGLGLAIVKHVVQRHGGVLQLSSTLGKGSTFSFTLPHYRVRFKKGMEAKLV